MSIDEAAQALCVETGCDFRTARRWLEGARPSRAVTLWALREAAKKLGIELEGQAKPEVAA